MLAANDIALWDVVISCEIVGSMDKDIQNPEIADIPTLLSKCPIRKIVTLGSTSHKLLMRYFPQYADICLALPSTSPANARIDAVQWVNNLRDALHNA